MASPGTMSSTSVVEVSIQAVVPVSLTGPLPWASRGNPAPSAAMQQKARFQVMGSSGTACDGYRSSLGTAAQGHLPEARWIRMQQPLGHQGTARPGPHLQLLVQLTGAPAGITQKESVVGLWIPQQGLQQVLAVADKV